MTLFKKQKNWKLKCACHGLIQLIFNLAKICFNVGVNEPFCYLCYILLRIFYVKSHLNSTYSTFLPMGQTIWVSTRFWKLVYHRGSFENSIHGWGLVDSLLHINMEHNWHLVRSFFVCCEKEQPVYIKHEHWGDPICTSNSTTGNNLSWHWCQNYLLWCTDQILASQKNPIKHILQSREHTKSSSQVSLSRWVYCFFTMLIVPDRIEYWAYSCINVSKEMKNVMQSSLRHLELL